MTSRDHGDADLNAAQRALDDLARERAAPRTSQRATVRLLDGTERTFTAWPVREGWHAAPPCSDSQPVYATPADAALAHARTLGLDAVDAVRERAAAPSPDDLRAQLAAVTAELDALRAAVRSFIDARDSWDGADEAAADKAYAAEDALRALVAEVPA